MEEWGPVKSADECLPGRQRAAAVHAAADDLPPWQRAQQQTGLGMINCPLTSTACSLAHCMCMSSRLHCRTTATLGLRSSSASPFAHLMAPLYAAACSNPQQQLKSGVNVACGVYKGGNFGATFVRRTAVGMPTPLRSRHWEQGQQPRPRDIHRCGSLTSSPNMPIARAALS